MDERSFMMARIDALADNLNLVEEALDAKQINDELRRAVKMRFGILIDKQKGKLEELQKNVDRGMQLEICSNSLRNINCECDRLFPEILAFVEGALVRSAGLDNGICYLADALLDDLSYYTDIPWARLTIMGEEEFFSQMAEIIRLRFPEFSIWNLPILGHEFGHLVSQELKIKGFGTSRYPFEVLQSELNVIPQEMPYFHEHFADIFATYTLGPAFACTCIVLRFDPSVASLDEREHPSYTKRVYLILEALKKMDEAGGGLLRPYKETIQRLEEIWYVTGRAERLDDSTIMRLNDWLKGIYGLIDEELPRSKFCGWLRAQGLAQELCSDSTRLPSLYRDHTLFDVLNAAWLCRLDQDKGSYKVQKISEKAIDLCQIIIKKRLKV